LEYNALISTVNGLEEQETLVVNIGAKSTNLLFINPTGFLTRSITVGGNTLTQNISDNLGTLFERAEEVKKSYFSGEVVYSADDPSVQVLQNCSQQFLTRTTQEITRSIVTYKRLKKGKAPTKMYLSGRGALLSNLPEYLSESQRLSIDYLDPLQSVIISDNLDNEIRPLLPYISGEPIGLARAVFKTDDTNALKTPLNLLPESKLTNLNFKKKVPILLFSAALLSCLPLIGVIFKSSAETHLKKELLEINSENRKLKSKILDLESLKEKYDFTEFTNQLLLNRNETFYRKSLSCWFIQDFLNQLQSSLDHPDVKDTWFDELYFEDKNTEKNSRNLKFNTKQNSTRIILVGRYLVRTTSVFSENQLDEKRNHLIELNSKKQEALTQYLETLPYIEKVDKKTFSIEGEGDLFKRNFTHFRYVFSPSF
jgi:type IV pilus assembly protein PilM